MEKGSVKVATERCKGCGLCVEVCPQGVLEVSDELNSSGYSYVEAVNEDYCIGCASCGMICPDVALTVYRKETSGGV